MKSKVISLLVIDDDSDLHWLLQHKLKLERFEVKSAIDGPSGLKMADKIQPALILLDWMMPGMDGLAVLRELKENSKTAKIPVFMLTAKEI